MSHSKYAYLLERPTQPTVYAKRLTHLIFQRPDLALAQQFLIDFGLRSLEQNENGLFFRTTESGSYCYHVKFGSEAKFLGFGLEVDSLDDLEKLSQLKGASQVQQLSTPGGGYGVDLRDPSSFLVQAVCQQTPEPKLDHRPALDLNIDLQQIRINQPQRLPVHPPEILKLGHVVLELADFKETIQWYMQHFAFIPSDVQVLPDGSPAVAFMRLNLGDTPADHHTLALAQGVMPTYSHSAYELVDTDAIGIGQHLLREKGWQHAWGIGRHILGSQIFDYWNDPWHSKHEHYCDGDLFDADMPTGIHPVSKKAMAQWGPVMPSSFTRPEISPENISKVLHHLKHSPDVTLKKVYTLAKIFM